MAVESPVENAFSRLGPVDARTPLVIAVPHAGRCYPESMLRAARLPRAALETIEDRHADLLIADAVSLGAVAIVARTARAFIDLNRDEREIDPAILATPPGAGRIIGSSKVRGGLGLIPSRIAAGGLVWRERLSETDIAARIEMAHRPYHAAITAAMDAAEARHGVAILIDCHSMPSLGPPPAGQLIVGDRHGRSAELRFTAAAIRAAAKHGHAIARNSPYAGGHTLDRHGNPDSHRHALQIEIDRNLYLDQDHRAPGNGLVAARRLVADIALALIDEAQGIALAAE